MDGRTLAATYARFLDLHGDCGPHGITGNVPHDGPALVVFTCRDCGGRAAWTGPAAESRRFLDAYQAVLGRGPVH